MNETEFWRLIELSGSKGPGTSEQAEALQEMLSRMPTEEIIGFERCFKELKANSYDWGLWGAAYIICGGCSDDGFDYFRGGLIAHGHDTYYAALRAPDSLADVPDPGVEEFEDMLAIAANAYEIKTGQDFPYEQIDHREPKTPKGKQWNENELDEMFPKLTKRYC